MKKFTALLMAIVMMFALSTVASAEEGIKLRSYDDKIYVIAEVNSDNAMYLYKLANTMPLTSVKHKGEQSILIFENTGMRLKLKIDDDLRYEISFIWESGMETILEAEIEYADKTVYVLGDEYGDIVIFPVLKALPIMNPYEG